MEQDFSKGVEHVLPKSDCFHPIFSLVISRTLMLVQLSAASSLFRPCVSNIFRALLLEAMFEPDHFSTCIEHSTSINLSTILKSHTKRALQSPGAHWFKLVWQAGKLASHRLVLRSERL